MSRRPGPVACVTCGADVCKCVVAALSRAERVLEAGKAYWAAGGKLRANMSDAETFEARRQLTLAQIELHTAMRDLWGEGGEG